MELVQVRPSGVLRLCCSILKQGRSKCCTAMPWCGAVLDFKQNPGAVFEFEVNLEAGPAVDLLSSSEMFSLQGVF